MLAICKAPTWPDIRQILGAQLTWRRHRDSPGSQSFYSESIAEVGFTSQGYYGSRIRRTQPPDGGKEPERERSQHYFKSKSRGLNNLNMLLDVA